MEKTIKQLEALKNNNTKKIDLQNKYDELISIDIAYRSQLYAIKPKYNELEKKVLDHKKMNHWFKKVDFKIVEETQVSFDNLKIKYHEIESKLNKNNEEIQKVISLFKDTLTEREYVHLLESLTSELAIELTQNDEGLTNKITFFNESISSSFKIIEQYNTVIEQARELLRPLKESKRSISNALYNDLMDCPFASLAEEATRLISNNNFKTINKMIDTFEEQLKSLPKPLEFHSRLKKIKSDIITDEWVYYLFQSIDISRGYDQVNIVIGMIGEIIEQCELDIKPFKEDLRYYLKRREDIIFQCLGEKNELLSELWNTII